MKKLNLILGIICAFAVCLVSCQKEKTTGQIQGLVTNANTSEPIQGVNISLSPTGASAVTGSDGRYEFANLQPGNYTVQGVKTGFESNTKNITITSGNTSSDELGNHGKPQLACRHAQHRQPARRPRDHHHSEH